MAIRNIRTDGDDILRKVCKPVKEMTPRISELIDDMFETMYEANGVGLAAPQVGVLKRIVVIDVFDDHPLVLINPEIVESDGEQIGEEGCLSLDGVRKTTRYQNIEVEYQDVSGKKHRQKYSGWTAQIIQHECDHLNGIII